MNKQIDYIQSQIDNFDISLYFTFDDYQKHLNETLDSIFIAGIEFFQGDILRNLDPIAFEGSYDGYITCCYDYTQLDAYQALWDELIELQGQFYIDCDGMN